MSLWSRECPVCADIGWCNDHPIKDHDDMTTKPNEPDALEPCPHCGAGGATNSKMMNFIWLEKSDHEDPEYHVHCWICGATGGLSEDRNRAIAAWNRRDPAQPVADAGGVTAADHEAAAAYLESMGQLASAERARNPVTPSGGPLSQAFSRHRLKSVAAATAAKDAEIARMREVLSAINAEANAATSSDGKERDPWAIGRIAKWSGAALSEAREAGELPQDVVTLVIAARETWEAMADRYEDSSEADKLDALDKALMPFGERVPYENQPEECP